MSTPIKPSQRTSGRQVPERVSHDFATAAAILDAGLVAHVGFQHQQQPFVIPMAYGRDGDQLLLHGASISRVMTELAQGIPICATVTHLDGIVLSRSAFNHSMNYRSVMVLGTAQAILDPAEKAIALEKLVEFIVPGRSAESRAGDGKEINATHILRLPIREFSIKQRSGPPHDPAKDNHVLTWTGEIPLQLHDAEPIPEPGMTYDGPVPKYACGFLSRRLRNLKR